MLTKFKSPLEMLRGYSQDCRSSRKGLVMLVGLQTLVQISEAKSNIVIKSAIKIANQNCYHHYPPPTPTTTATTTTTTTASTTTTTASTTTTTATTTTTTTATTTTTTIELSCYLKSCYLCNKNLSLDKDIYMYRGDQGFCSIECRNRQIALEEMGELEASTKQMRKSYRNCSSSAGRNETRLLLEELRRRRRNNNKPVTRAHRTHWAIAS